MSGTGSHGFRDALTFSGMVMMELVTVGLNTLFKAATLKGMSYHVFVVYAYAIAALALLPSAFIAHRSKSLPPLTSSILFKIGLLAIIGGSAQMLGYSGINYSSPTLASAISNLTPAFTFILAIIFRMEEFALRTRSGQAKFLGTIVSVAGAFVMTLDNGPPIFTTRSPHLVLDQPLQSPNSNWIIGGIFCTAQNVLIPLWLIVQTQIVTDYPEELTVLFFYNLFVSIIAAVVALITEGTSSAWILQPHIALASVICSGLFGSCLTNVVHTWGLQLKGPVYVAMFKPLSIAIAAAMGFMFLGDPLYLGSLIGAVIIVIGFYMVMWGKSKDLEQNYSTGRQGLESPSPDKLPLLQQAV